MCAWFACELKGLVAATFLSSFIAAGVAAATGSGVAERERPTTMSVNRVLKGDRLPQTSLLSQYPKDPAVSEGTSASPKRPPLGCDPAFSPISAPGLAHIFKRCMA